MIACAAGHVRIVDLLLAAGADVHKKWRGETALTVAASKSRKDIASKLLSVGADVTLKDSKGRSALSRSIQADMVRFLVEQGCPVDGRDLHGPVMARDVDIVKLLLSKQPDVNARFDWPSPGGWIPKGATPLHVAANDTMAEMMIKCGAPGNLSLRERIFIVELLLSAGADVNAQHPKTGWTPLLLATNSDQPEIAARLIDAGADPHHQFECEIKHLRLGQPRTPVPKTFSAITLAEMRPENIAIRKLLLGVSR